MSIKRPSILLISFVFSPNLGGIETHLDDLVEYLSGKKYQVTVITYQPLLSSKNALPIEKKGSVEIRRIRWIRGNLYNKLAGVPILQMLYLVPPIFIYSFIHLLKHRKNYSIIQTHGFNMAIVGVLLSFVYKIPFTVNTHVSFHFEKGLYAQILEKVLSRARNILVLTQESKKELIKIGIKPEKIIVYHYWVNRLYQPINRLVCRKKLKIDNKVFVVLFVGRLIRDKGVDLLLKAAEKIKGNTLFIIAGTGPLEQLVLDTSKRTKNIHYVNELTRDELPYYYSASDICIIPSNDTPKTYTEGIPRVMIESFSCATPVIASTAGGLKTYVTDKVGFLVNLDTDSVIQCLTRVYSQRQKLPKMRRNCITLAKEQFSFDRNAAIIEHTLI